MKFKEAWSSMIERCKNAARYKGKRIPRCDGGRGCRACWRIWRAVNYGEHLK